MAWEKVIAAVPQPAVPELVIAAGRVAVHAPLPSEPPGSPAVLCLWFEEVPSHLPGQAYLVEERLQWEVEPRPNITRFSFLQRAGGITREDFSRHWSEIHAPLARVHHPCLVRYVQNIVREVLTPGTADLDGIAELSVDRVEDFTERMYDSAGGREIIGADVRTFIDVTAGWRVVTD
jgi:uncharacterized protein (TIGR02118 family)